MSDITKYETGAFRDGNIDKLDFEACFSPLVMRRYAEYKRSHRRDGRKDDNWQLGMDIQDYMKSMYRHFEDVHMIHDGFECAVDIEEALCGVLFNVQGYLFEILKKKQGRERDIVEAGKAVLRHTLENSEKGN